MQDLKVAIVQANQIWEDKEANFTNFERLLEKVEGIDLILLPEMFHTGFSMNAEELAETMDESKGLEWLKNIAKNKNSAIYTSLIIKENEKYFNRGVFVHPSGTIETYDKRKTFGLAGEDKIYTAGLNEKIVNYKGWNLQLQICYDLRFPEIVRNRILTNDLPAYDAILYVANWPDKRIEHWNTLLKARAIENQSYVIAVNRVGRDNSELNYTGHSAGIDPLGKIIKSNDNKEEVLFYQLIKLQQEEILKSFPFLKDIKIIPRNFPCC